MALTRVTTRFFFLLAITLEHDGRGLSELTAGDVFRPTLLGGLGVGSNVIAAWGLRLISVIHYIVIYSLLSPVTALFSVVRQKGESSPLKIIGIVTSLGRAAESRYLRNSQVFKLISSLVIPDSYIYDYDGRTPGWERRHREALRSDDRQYGYVLEQCIDAVCHRVGLRASSVR